MNISDAKNKTVALNTQNKPAGVLSIVAPIALGLAGGFVGVVIRDAYLSSTGRANTSEAHVLLLLFACLAYIITLLVISIIRASISRNWLYLISIPLLASSSLLAFAFWTFEFGALYLPGLVVTQGLIGYLCTTYLKATWRVIGVILALTVPLIIFGQVFTNNVIGPHKARESALEAYEQKLVWILPGFEVADGYDDLKIEAYGYSDLFGPGYEDIHIQISSLPGSLIPNCNAASYKSSDTDDSGSECVRVGNGVVVESRFTGSSSQLTSSRRADSPYNYATTLFVQKEGVLVVVKPSSKVPPSVVQAYADKVQESLVLWDGKAFRGY